MTVIRTSELVGKALDYAVAMAEGLKVIVRNNNFEALFADAPRFVPFQPSTDWAHGGLIIERQGISVSLRFGSLPPNHGNDVWDAIVKPETWTTGRPGSGCKREVIVSGPLPLIAAMRCHIASQLGDSVDIPSDLL